VSGIDVVVRRRVAHRVWIARTGRGLLGALVLLNAAGAPALAHRDDYLDETPVFQTLERHEKEPEYWFDYGRRDDTRQDMIWHNVALEYGVSEHFMIDGRLRLASPQGEETTFESGRFEARKRFGEEGDRRVDVAISGEVNAERNDLGETIYGVEPRLILSRDIVRWNLTLNVAEEIPFHSEHAALLPSLGVRLNASRHLRVGAELKENLHTHEDSFVPQIWFDLPGEVTLKLGESMGINQSDERFVRLAVEVGF